jgi:organic radical activating enzyme
MAKYEWSEVFQSIEGEAKFSGHPTAYVRFARCNFKCPLFNNHNKDLGEDGYADLGWKPIDFKSLNDIPLLHKGCDSQYAVNPAFAHMWHKGDETELATALFDILPNKTFVTKHKPIILSLTGGEPTIRIKFWIPLLEKAYENGMRHILIETNCASPLRPRDVDALYDWAVNKGDVRITWSNSPKLSVSGETWEDAIRPEIAMAQITHKEKNILAFVDSAYWNQRVDQYFKFVCDPSETHFAEVDMAMEAYYQAGISRDAEVYIMPTACTEEQQQEVSAKVAQMCIERGYIYCHRIQNSVFGNGVGT